VGFLSLEFSLNVVNTILILGVSLPSIYMARRVSAPTLKRLSILLSSFLFFHGVYHLTEALGAYSRFDLFSFLSDAVFEPLGWFLLLAFAAFYFRLWR